MNILGKIAKTAMAGLAPLNQSTSPNYGESCTYRLSPVGLFVIDHRWFC
jgi:hypothetical protein